MMAAVWLSAGGYSVQGEINSELPGLEGEVMFRPWRRSVGFDPWRAYALSGLWGAIRVRHVEQVEQVRRLVGRVSRLRVASSKPAQRAWGQKRRRLVVPMARWAVRGTDLLAERDGLDKVAWFRTLLIRESWRQAMSVEAALRDPEWRPQQWLQGELTLRDEALWFGGWTRSPWEFWGLRVADLAPSAELGVAPAASERARALMARIVRPPKLVEREGGGSSDALGAGASVDVFAGSELRKLSRLAETDGVTLQELVGRVIFRELSVRGRF